MDAWLHRYRGWLFLTLVVLILAGAALFQLRRPVPPAIVLATPAPSLPPEPSPTPRPFRVYVSGAVQHPDVYSLPPDSIVKNALVAAGGATADADLDRINLAMALVDGQQVHVPRKGEDPLPIEPASNAPAAGGRVNINTATATELETLPGIGPALAQRIAEYRQVHGAFSEIKDIMQVSGIGEATFSKIQDLITTK